MALPPEIDNQNVLGVLVDRLRPGASWGTCDDLAALTATWRDEILTVPTEQEFVDEYALWQIDIASEADGQQAADNAADLFKLVKADFLELRDVLEPHYLAISPSARQNLKNRFQLENWTNVTTTDQQRGNSLGYATAVLFLAIDAVQRRMKELQE